MNIMSKQVVIEAAKKEFHRVSIVMNAETHPQEFAIFLQREANCGRYWFVDSEAQNG